MISTFALAQLLTVSGTISRRPAAVGGLRSTAVEIGSIATMVVVPAAAFGRVFGATPPLAGGKAGYIALILEGSLDMETEGDTLQPGDTLTSDGQDYAVIGRPALWHDTLLAVDLNLAAA